MSASRDYTALREHLRDRSDLVTYMRHQHQSVHSVKPPHPEEQVQEADEDVIGTCPVSPGDRPREGGKEQHAAAIPIVHTAVYILEEQAILPQTAWKSGLNFETVHV